MKNFTLASLVAFLMPLANATSTSKARENAPATTATGPRTETSAKDLTAACSLPVTNASAANRLKEAQASCSDTVTKPKSVKQ